MRRVTASVQGNFDAIHSSNMRRSLKFRKTH